MTYSFILRPIEPRDDATIAKSIRTVMPAFGADGPGFAIHDAEVDTMSTAYSRPRSRYFVIEADGAVQGGAGIAPLDGGAADVCELRKMYFLPTLRGRGAGKAAIDRCLEAARGFGFRRCYIETLTGMDAAQKLYLANGFERISCAMGGTGHHGCDRYYIRSL